MKRIITDNITGSVRQKFTKYSLDHLQNAREEDTNNLLKILNSQIFNDDGEVYVLKGLTTNGLLTNETSAPYTIYAGYIYYAGNIYAVENSTVTPGAGQVLCLYKKATYLSTDPTNLSDLSTANVHANYSMVISGGTSGSGSSTSADLVYICDYSSILPLVFDTEWNTVSTYTSPYATYDVTTVYEGLQVKKLKDNTIVLQGWVLATNPSAANVTICTLDTGYRPSRLHTSIPSSNNGTYCNTTTLPIISVQSSGVIKWESAVPASGATYPFYINMTMYA